MSKFYITGILNQRVVNNAINIQITAQNTYTLIPRFGKLSF